jgi:hypothetical protein
MVAGGGTVGTGVGRTGGVETDFVATAVGVAVGRGVGVGRRTGVVAHAAENSRKTTIP